MAGGKLDTIPKVRGQAEKKKMANQSRMIEVKDGAGRQAGRSGAKPPEAFPFDGRI